LKILIINYHYPPSKTAHSYRWAQLADYYKSQGYHVDIIAGGEGSEYDCIDNVTRVNCPFTIRSNSKDFIAKNIVKLSEMQNIKINCIHLLKKAYRAIFWPDGLWHWLPFALYAVLLRKNKKYDLVIGYSPTFSAVLAARFYKLFNNNTRLILDFGDPFSTSDAMPVNNYLFYNRLNYFFEKVVFSASSKVTFTNQQTYEIYNEKYPGIKSFEVCPHLVDIDLFYKKHFVKNKKALKFGYVGAFHKGIREPNLTIKILQELRGRLGFIATFYGPLNGVEFKETEHLTHNGCVSRVKAIQLLQSFDIIINVENEACPMTPSKINEYVALGKPVINFLSKTNTSSFINYPFVFNVSNDTECFELKKFIESNCEKQLSKIEIEEVLGNCALNKVANRYLAT